MNIAFVVDTSISMGQKTSQGVSFLDCAKAGVDHFIKTRQRSGYENSNDKYHLILTDSQYPVRSTWEHDVYHLLKSLTTIKRVESNISLNSAVCLAFKQLNMFRHASSTDTYGHGRNTSKSEPGAVIVLSDNQIEKLRLEDWKSSDSSEFTLGAWRYDQRLFVINLQSDNYQNKDWKKVQELTEFTGGGFYTCISFRHILNISEKISGNLNEHVVTARLETEDKAIPLILMLDKRNKSSFWPIPEEFTNFSNGLAPRPCNPVFTYRPSVIYSNFRFPAEFPIDCYGIISTRKFEEQFVSSFPVRPVYIPVFMKDHLQPFAVIALEDTGYKFLNLCYNFLELWEYLDYFKTPNGKSDKARQYEDRFLMYLRELPVYYLYPLTKALKNMKVFLPNSLKFPSPISLSPDITLKLKTLKQIETTAKSEMDRISKIIQEQHHSEMATCCQIEKHNLYCDIFSIDRDHLQGSITIMSLQFFGDSHQHEVPISRMGDYISFASKMEVFRNAYSEPGEEKIFPINFGNPFRSISSLVSKDNLIIADDPNISLPTMAKSTQNQVKVELVSLPVKRNKGFETQMNTCNFSKRNSKRMIYLVMVEIVSYLRQRSAVAEDKLVALLRSTVNKIFKKKNSNKINSYTEGKVVLLDAVMKQAAFYNKRSLISIVENLKSSLQTPHPAPN